tara:strand:+ start:975 stop:1244 length:270 start_codon:yes stop_codon:yes gene_type:complete
VVRRQQLQAVALLRVIAQLAFLRWVTQPLDLLPATNTPIRVVPLPQAARLRQLLPGVQPLEIALLAFLRWVAQALFKVQPATNILIPAV